MITDGFCMSLFTSCFYYSFVQRHQRKTDYDLIERVLGQNKGKNLRHFHPWREILLSHQRAVLPRDYLSRDCEDKAPGWSHTWMKDKAGCPHRQRYSLLIQKGPSSHSLTGFNGFCDTTNKSTWTAILVQIKGQNHSLPCLHQQPHIDMQECNSRPSVQNTSS